MTQKLPDPHFVAVDRQTGEPGDTAVLEEQGIAYDPTKMTVDLTKEEKRRTTALMLAINAYDHLIIKDAEMYNAISRDADRKGGPVIRPATMIAMVEAAIQFDAFISGALQAVAAKAPTEPEQDSSQSGENGPGE